MEEKIFFNDSAGNRLCGILSLCSENKNDPILVLVHGFSSNKNTKSFDVIRQLLEEKHISTFRIDLYAHGESEGNFEELTLSKAVDSILHAISLLKKQGYTKIGLLGSSFGGNASIVVASKVHNLFALALKSPASNYEEKAKKDLLEKGIQEWKEQGYRIIEDDTKSLKLNYTFFEDAKQNDGYKAAPLISTPTFIVHGDNDESVAVEQSIKIAKLIPNCELLLIKGADHTYTNPDNMKKMSEAMVNFIVEHI